MNIEESIRTVIAKNLDAATIDWLDQQSEQIRKDEGSSTFVKTFSQIPRKLFKEKSLIETGDIAFLSGFVENWSPKDWTIVRLVRVWIIMQVKDNNSETYQKKFDLLFDNAEMNELSALYSALPFFDYPEIWKGRCAEGIRSNIGTVLEAIMYENPYPRNYLDEDAWNQLVMKAFFTSKDMLRITGLYERNNLKLANILRDFAKERQSAGRPVPEHLQELAEKFNES